MVQSKEEKNAKNKVRMREYNNRPDVVAKRKKYNARPERKVKLQEHYAKPGQKRR